jgi:flagellar hook-length control protein FliK
VVLQTDNNEVKQILQSHVESLRGSLRSQGLVADSIQVFTQDKTDGGGYGYEGNEPFFGESPGRERSGGGRDENGVVSRYAPPSPGEEPRAVRSDGRISVFA